MTTFRRRAALVLVLVALTAGGLTPLAGRGQEASPAAEASPAPNASPVVVEAPNPCDPSAATPEAIPAAEIDPATLQFDLLYLELMLQHHLATVDMAKVVLERAGRIELITMAQGMIDLRTQQLEQMRAWRQELFPEVPPLTEQQIYAGFDAQQIAPSRGGGIPGLEDMSPSLMRAEVQGFCEAEGEFDLFALDHLIAHLNGAVLLSSGTVDYGSRTEIREFASVLAGQAQADITQLLSWRDIWYGDAPSTQEGAGI